MGKPLCASHIFFVLADAESSCRRPDKSDKMFTDKDIAAMRWIADKREAKEGGRPASAAAPAAAAKSPDQKQLESIIDRASEDSEAFQVGRSMPVKSSTTKQAGRAPVRARVLTFWAYEKPAC